MFDDALAQERDQPFFVCDLGNAERQLLRWRDAMPDIEAFYAVKCNPDPVLIRHLASLGSGFDCASKAEIVSCLDAGVAPENIIFANPIKSLPDIEFARSVGVKTMTFDNEDELVKVQSLFPEARMVLRILPDDSGSKMRFGSKFGAAQENFSHLIFKCRSLGLELVGTSFHIGSGCFDASKYDSAIKLCRQVFDLATEAGMPPLKLLDVGGGFPGNPVLNQPSGAVPPFETFAHAITQAVERYFPSSQFPELRKIGEPGRYIATSFSTLFAKVQGKRVQSGQDVRRILYYINDGVYSSFNNVMFDHAAPVPLRAADLVMLARAASSNDISRLTEPKFARAMHMVASSTSEPALSTFFGPTCDSIDVVAKDVPMPELFVGDWLAFVNMGAYTSAAASSFNGIPQASKIYVHSERPDALHEELMSRVGPQQTC